MLYPLTILVATNNLVGSVMIDAEFGRDDHGSIPIIAI
jgi:hypothetical protein